MLIQRQRINPLHHVLLDPQHLIRGQPCRRRDIPHTPAPQQRHHPGALTLIHLRTQHYIIRHHSPPPLAYQIPHPSPYARSSPATSTSNRLHNSPKTPTFGSNRGSSRSLPSTNALYASRQTRSIASSTSPNVTTCSFQNPEAGSRFSHPYPATPTSECPSPTSHSSTPQPSPHAVHTTCQ